MIPVRECRRRQKKEEPSPALRGATPVSTCTEGAGLADDATSTPYKFGDEERTFYYLGAGEGKSRKGYRWCFVFQNTPLRASPTSLRINQCQPVALLGRGRLVRTQN